MVSKSSTVISCHQHKILLLAIEISIFLNPFFNFYICCMVLCDRVGIIIASSVSRRTYEQKIQWNCSEGERERRLMFQKVNSRTPYITMIGYQTIQFANNYSEGSSLQPERLLNIYKLLQFCLQE